MVKRIIVTIVLIAVLLSACGNGLVFDDKAAIRFAQKNKELIQQCVDIIYSEYLPKGGAYFFFEENERLYMRDYERAKNDWEGSVKEIECPEISKLLRYDKIQEIAVWNQQSVSHSTEFCLKTFGMGSSSRSYIVFIPSGQIEEFEFYSSRMQFSEFREGVMGTIEGSDDYLYYVPLRPCYFYMEYGD